MKFCPRCKEKKPLDTFFKKKDRRASSYCKPCQLEYVREHYRRTKGAYNARRYVLAETYKERNRRLVFAHLTENPCVDCAERDILVLDFDHVQGAKLSSISRMINDCVSVGKLRIEIEKCEVRCANCHRRKTCIRAQFVSHETVAIRPGSRSARGCTAPRILGRPGLEPGTNSLKGYCSTIELPSRTALWCSSERCSRVRRCRQESVAA